MAKPKGSPESYSVGYKRVVDGKTYQVVSKAGLHAWKRCTVTSRCPSKKASYRKRSTKKRSTKKRSTKKRSTKKTPSVPASQVPVGKVRVGLDGYKYESRRSMSGAATWMKCGGKVKCAGGKRTTPLGPENMYGGANKLSTKKRSAKKLSTKKRSTKKRSTKKHSAKKHSTKKHSTKKRSTKRYSY